MKEDEEIVGWLKATIEDRILEALITCNNTQQAYSDESFNPLKDAMTKYVEDNPEDVQEAVDQFYNMSGEELIHFSMVVPRLEEDHINL